MNDFEANEFITVAVFFPYATDVFPTYLFEEGIVLVFSHTVLIFIFHS